MSVACGIECVVVLKGSSHGRTTDKPEGEIDEITTLKDLDCEFLEAERIMDYSLLGCIRWVWRRCTYIGANDNATWTTAVPRVCRLVLAIYEHDLHNPYFIPTCGFHPNPNWVFKRVTYDVSMTSNRPSHVSVDSRPACGPAWAGGQAKGWAGVHKQVLGNIWIGCWVNDETVELL